MDSRRRIPTTELPRCVSAGSADTGNLEGFFLEIVNCPKTVEAYRQSPLCSGYPSPTPSTFFLPHENLCLQSVAMLASSQSPRPVTSFFPQALCCSRSHGIFSHPLILGSFGS